MPVEIHTEPFRFPNFLKVKEWDDNHKLDCGYLSETNAASYWDELKPLWLEHCRKRRDQIRANRGAPTVGDQHGTD